jgi:hypothetical protein
MTRRSVLALALAAQTAACYSYVEVPLESIAPGSEVRVGIGSEASDRLRDALAADQRALEGHVSSADAGGLLLDVVAATRQLGFQFERLRQTVRLERSDVRYVELKRLDRQRTYIGLGVGALAAGAITFKALSGKTGGDTRPPTGGGTADARVVRPWLIVSVPFR